MCRISHSMSIVAVWDQSLVLAVWNWGGGGGGGGAQVNAPASMWSACFFFFSSLQEMSRRETACCCFLIGFCWYASGCYFFVYFLSCQESLPRSAGKKGIQFPSPHSGNWIKKTKTENKNINSFWYVHEFSWLLALKNFFCLLDFFFVWDWNSGSYVCHLWWWL